MNLLPFIYQIDAIWDSVRTKQLSKSETTFIDRFGSHNVFCIDKVTHAGLSCTPSSVHVHVQRGRANVREYPYPAIEWESILLILVTP